MLDTERLSTNVGFKGSPEGEKRKRVMALIWVCIPTQPLPGT